MKVGIVGLPNAGKSTLFNALTRAGAQTGDYPFTTVEPNVAVASVPDERLDRSPRLLGSSETIRETIEFHDIAGLVRGASEGEGLGNQFLAAIRETDAICHVVRCHEDTRVPHPDGKVDPVADTETVETELLLADLEQAERRLERVTKQARSGDKEAIAERDWLQQVATRSPRAPGALGPGARRGRRRPAQAGGADLQAGALRRQRRRGRRRGAGGGRRPRRRRGAGARRDQRPDRGASWPSSTRDEAAEMRAELGLAESGLERLVRAAYELLELITFFTADRGQGGDGAQPAPRRARPGTRPARCTPTSRTASSGPR